MQEHGGLRRAAGNEIHHGQRPGFCVRCGGCHPRGRHRRPTGTYFVQPRPAAAGQGADAGTVTLLLVPILTMLTIVINVSFNNASGVIGGVAALLIITLSIPPDNTFTYVIARVFETFCGVFIAILVNYDYDWLLKHLK